MIPGSKGHQHLIQKASVTHQNVTDAFLCHRKLRPMTQKRSAGCALAQRRNMSQATALGARMCQGTFFLTSQEMFM